MTGEVDRWRAEAVLRSVRRRLDSLRMEYPDNVAREVRVHPADWQAFAVHFGQREGHSYGPATLYGVPLVKDDRVPEGAPFVVGR